MEEQGVLRREELKVIYVAPMKALAQEIVEKFKERLSRLGLIVRELTGKNEWMDGWMDEWMEGWMDGWMVYISSSLFNSYNSHYLNSSPFFL